MFLSHLSISMIISYVQLLMLYLGIKDFALQKEIGECVLEKIETNNKYVSRIDHSRVDFINILL